MTNMRCTACGMPPVDGGHNCPALASMPSREFLIRQAVLNWLWKEYPMTTKADGPARILQRIFGEKPNYLVDFLRQGVLEQYRALLKTHGGQSCR